MSIVGEGGIGGGRQLGRWMLGLKMLLGRGLSLGHGDRVLSQGCLAAVMLKGG